MSFEQALQGQIFSHEAEKSFLDKLLAKDDVKSIQELMKKPKLDRQDLLELLYLISSNEAKLLNYGSWDRYIILKFFVWIREILKTAETLYDYQDDLKKKSKTCKECDKLIEELGREKRGCYCKNPQTKMMLSKRTETLLYNNERSIEHSLKFLVDLYLNIGRTSLSLGGSAFFEGLKINSSLVIRREIRD